MKEPPPDAGFGVAGGAGDRDRRRRDVANYIGTMCGELRGMAEQADLRLLAYLLDMARLEADLLDPGVRPGQGFVAGTTNDSHRHP